jgi:hypothetical protein
MSDSPVVFCGPSNGHTGRLVVFQYSGREYRDHIDTDSGFAREKAIARAAERFGLDVADLSHLDAAIVRAADEEDQRADRPETIDYQPETVAELESADLETEFLIDRTLVARQPCIMAGSKKSLKTSLLIDLGVSLAMGGYFLGKLKVARACRVALMSGESGRATIRETIRRVCGAAGYDPSGITGMLVTEKLPRFGNAAHTVALERFILDNELGAVIIDPAYLAMPGGDAANLMLMGELLRELSEVCTGTGCTPILCHHCRKGGKADPFEAPELEDIAWAGFQEWARQWLLVGRREKYEPGSGEHRLWLSIGGSAGHSALWAIDLSEGVFPDRYWQVTLSHADEARQEAAQKARERREASKAEEHTQRLESDKKRLVEALAKYPEGATERTLHGASGVYGERFRSALAELVRTGDVAPCEINKSCRKTPYEGWKLADSDVPQG